MAAPWAGSSHSARPCGRRTPKVCLPSAPESTMTYAWTLAALWLGLALLATLFALWFRVSTALTEIIVGTLAQLILGSLFGADVLGGNESWVKLLAGGGTIVLTFLAARALLPAGC